jgi:phytoene desaturase
MNDMHERSSGNHETYKKPYVAVIGSGFGGLAAAIRLQAAGVRTTLFEARDKPGGRAYVYERDGFVFDAGPTVITAPHCIEELFEVAGRRLDDYVELLPVQPFYRLVWPDGDSIDYSGGDALHEQIRARSEKDAAGYARFVEYSAKVFAEGYEKLAATPFLRFMDMVRVAPQLAGLRADRHVYGTVARFVEDEHVRQALSFHSLLVGGNPFETSSIYTLIHYLERKWGVFFPRGGTGALVRALVTLYEELGGEIRLNCPVTRIETGKDAQGSFHRVHAASETPTRFDAVLSNADLHHTYDKLYAENETAQKTARKLERSEWSMSLFVLYFGTNHNYDIAHHTVVFGERYEELLREIFHGHELPEDFSLYLHAPTVTDPSLAPPGCGSYYVLSPVPHLGNAPIDWEREGPRYADRILASLERLMPDLRSRIVTKFWFTPNDFAEQLGAYHGSAFSLAPRLSQSAWFRPHNKDPKIDGLYIAGAGTHPGAGVPGVINSAKATTDLILRDFGLQRSGQDGRAA